MSGDGISMNSLRSGWGESHGRGVGRKPVFFYAFPLAGRKHCFHVWKAVFGDRGDKGNTLFVDQVTYGLFRVSHHNKSTSCLFYGNFYFFTTKGDAEFVDSLNIMH